MLWVSVVGQFIAALGIAGVGASTWLTYQQVELTRQQIGLDERPWVALSDVQLNGPLAHDNSDRSPDVH
jgi:hypothetical protein